MFPSRDIYEFWPLLYENFGSVFLTRVRPGLSNFNNLPLERVFRSGTWRQRSRIFPSSDFYAFAPTIGRKLRFGFFDQGANMWVKFLKSSTWSEYFAPELEGNYPKCLPLVIFPHFGRPLAENFGSVFSTGMRLEPGISHLEMQPDSKF